MQILQHIHIYSCADQTRTGIAGLEDPRPKSIERQHIKKTKENKQSSAAFFFTFCKIIWQESNLQLKGY